MIRYRLHRIGNRVRLEDGGAVLYMVRMTKDGIHVYDGEGKEKGFLQSGEKKLWHYFKDGGKKDCTITFAEVETLRPARPLYAEIELDDGSIEVKNDKNGEIFLYKDIVIGSIKNLYSIYSILSIEDGCAVLLPVLLVMAYAIYLSDGLIVV